MVSAHRLQENVRTLVPLCRTYVSNVKWLTKLCKASRLSEHRTFSFIIVIQSIVDRTKIAVNYEFKEKNMGDEI